MNELRIVIVVTALAGFVGSVQPVFADVFKSAKECVPGKRVTDKGGKSGKVIGMTKGDPTMCDVQIDGADRVSYYIFWMLRDEGKSAETDAKLVSGTYECFAGGRYTFMDLKITGVNTYESADSKGKFHVEASRKIVFESGPLSKNHAKLLAGPSIGLNSDGGTFYA